MKKKLKMWVNWSEDAINGFIMHCFKTEPEAIDMAAEYMKLGIKFIVVAHEVETPWDEDVLKDEE